MDFDCFSDIRDTLCAYHADVTEGKMMSSPAIHHKGKVFAFFSRKQKLVVKLGKDYPLESLDVPVQEFSPFKTKKTLSGWYELDALNKDSWEAMANLALELAKQQF